MPSIDKKCIQDNRKCLVMLLAKKFAVFVCKNANSGKIVYDAAQRARYA